MRLSSYILRDFISIFLTTFFIVTFTMCLLSLPKVVEIMSRGIDIKVVGVYFINLLSYLISYSIPISALFSSLLLFGRLSVDNELNAMRSSGLSLWQISSPVILVGLVLSLLCLYNNSYIYPHKRYANRVLTKELNINDPIKLLDEGRSIREFPGYIIYVKEKQDNRVFDLIIYEINEHTQSVKSCIQSKEGLLRLNQEAKILFIDLYDARIERLSATNDIVNKNQYAAARQYSIPLDISTWVKHDAPPKSRRDMTLPQLIINARNYQESHTLISGQYWVRVHQRIYMGMAPLTFILVGIPLGIRSHRKESSSGMIISLMVIFIYYCLILIADGLDNRPEWSPWLIPWMGTILAQLGGLYLLKKMD